MTPDVIIGIGNILLRDEGVGVHVAQAMQAMDLPDHVEVVDGGTSGADLVDVLADRRRVVVVDAVRGDAKPGTVVLFPAEDLLPEDAVAVSLHQLGLVDSLLMTRQLGCYPQEVRVVGIYPVDISPGLELSEVVARVVPKVIDFILSQFAESAEIEQIPVASAHGRG